MSSHVKKLSAHQIYPKRYFDASPTWRKWNILTAADVHSLREERGFEGQNVYFCLNHPIQYVRLVGLVVDIEVKSGKFILISLDDSSGACIDIKTELRQLKQDDHTQYPSNTVIDSLDVNVGLGETTVLINRQPIDIGTVIKAKGTIDSFRGARQLKLERIWTVKSTNEEAKAWAETAQWKRDVLSKPWTLTQAKRHEIDALDQETAAKERERSRKRRAWDAEYTEKKKRHDQKLERRRVREEQKLNAGALAGSHVLPQRVTDS